MPKTAAFSKVEVKNNRPLVIVGGSAGKRQPNNDERAPDSVEGEFSPKIGRRNENFLSRYFREMGALSVLRPEQEFEYARNIERLEVELWQHLLSYPKMADVISAIVDAEISPSARIKQGFRQLSSNIGPKRVPLRSTTSSRGQKCKQVELLAQKIYGVDTDRGALLTVMHELHRIARGDPERTFSRDIGVRRGSRAFQTYLSVARTKYMHAQHARNEFVKANLRLVVSIARRFHNGRLPLGDLIQEGNVGLIKAVERYDYRRGYRFSTYASWWIRHAIGRALADKGRAVRVPVHMIDAHNKVNRVRRELSNKLGRVPTSEEVAIESGISEEKVDRLTGSMMEQPLSLDGEVSENDGRRHIEFVASEDAPSPSERVLNRALSERVMSLMTELKPIEANILRQRFGLGNGEERTLKEIGQELNLSRERIRQLQERALYKIRCALSEKNDA